MIKSLFIYNIKHCKEIYKLFLHALNFYIFMFVFKYICNINFSCFDLELKVKFKKKNASEVIELIYFN